MRVARCPYSDGRPIGRARLKRTGEGTEVNRSEKVSVLWECDQCAYREWRPADQEPWLCVVCGYERWHAIREHTVRDDVPEPDS
jgi:hypothetical protein